MLTHTETVTRTIRLKVKTNCYPWLNAAAVEVNQVWNWANETSLLAATRTDTKRKCLTGFDLCKLTSGASKEFEHIGAHTICRVCNEFGIRRLRSGKSRLRWRLSGGSRRSLGWVPFKSESIKLKGRSIRFCKKSIRVFRSEKLVDCEWHQGCFAQDAVGDWWLCLPVEVPITGGIAPREVVGIDLGLKAIATTSDGDTLEAARFYRNSEQKIAQAQRRGHKRQAKRLHRKAKRQRANALHKFSRTIVDQYQTIVVGDVSSSRLAKTRMGKSVLDAGWGMLKTQLMYKGQQAGRSVEVVNEAFTTRACSECGSLSGPQGLRELVVREWTCVECGTAHDRDVNAARNILALRCQRPSAGMSL